MNHSSTSSETASHDQRSCEQLAQENQILKQRLIEAQKLTAMGELVSTTTHEFNNVLMAVINYARMGLRHKDETTRNNCFEKIAAAGEKAAKITTGVLALAKNRSNTMEPTHLQAIVEDTLVLLERELRRYRIDVDFQAADVPQALANGNQIQQVVLNLLVNARQAMPQGGRLVVRLSYDEAAGMVDLLVRDHGVGIAQEQLPHIFDPFFSTKSGPDATGKGGTGIGLSACRDIVESHQGKIRVQSTPGVGTAFTIRIPAACASPPQTGSVRCSIPAAASDAFPASSAQQ